MLDKKESINTLLQTISEQSIEVISSIINLIDIAILIQDAGGIIVEANNTSVNMFGYSSKEELLMQDALSFAVNYNQETQKSHREAMIAHLNKTFGGIFNIRKRDGTTFLADVRVNPINNSTGKMVGWITAYVPAHQADLSKQELKKLRILSDHEELKRERNKISLVRELHDEMGQITTAMKYSLYRLKKRLPNDDAVINKNIAEIFGFIDMTVESIQRISSELRPVVLDDFGLVAAIQWQVKKFKESTKIKCDLFVDPKIPSLPPEKETAVFRIFQEALTNVARHANASSVKITFTRMGKQLYLEVKDNGKGVLPEHVNSPNSFGITGMQERARSFGGNIMIYSEPNNGTKLSVTIPMTTAMTFETTNKVVFESDKKVLISDDHPTFRDGLKQIIDNISGIVVTDEADTGHETLEKVRQNNYDLLILDITMPDSNGLDLLKEIRRQKPKLPILILSMHSEEEYGLRAIRAGASGYLTKKTDPDQLIKAIQKIANGGKYITPTLSEAVAQDYEYISHSPVNMAFSDREHQILNMMLQGIRMKNITEQLHLSKRTIFKYRKHILEKTETKNTIGLIRWAIRNKLISDADLNIGDYINIQDINPILAKEDYKEAKRHNKNYHYKNITENKDNITIINNAENNSLHQDGNKLAERIFNWINCHAEWWSTKEMDKELDINTPKDKNNRRVVLFRLEKQGLIERHETEIKRWRYTHKNK